MLSRPSAFPAESSRVFYRLLEQASLVRAGEAPVTFDVPVVLSTGAYTLHLGVLDDRSGRWGASRLSLFVPEFDTGGLRMSTTVRSMLISRRLQHS